MSAWRVLGAIVTLVVLSGCSLPWSSDAGSIDFGFGFHRVSVSQLTVVSPRTSFFTGEPIGWVAHLKKPAGAPVLTLRILDAKTHRLAVRLAVPKVNPRFTELADVLPVRFLERLGATAPGVYILQYVRGETVLAQGTFTILR